MFKKFLVVIFVLCFSTFVEAEEKKDTYYLEFEKIEGINQKGAVAGFDENNVLISADICEISEGEESYSTSAELLDKTKSIRIYFPKTQAMVKNFIKAEKGEIATPEEEPTPVPTKEPVATPTPQEALSRYPTKLDEATAFMMVNDVTTIVVDDEIKTLLKVFYRGEETEIYVDENMEISSAPDINSDMAGKSVSALATGDIIYCSTNTAGKLRTVELIYRPIEEEIVFADEDFGKNFEKLFAIDGQVTKARPVSVAAYGSDTYKKQEYAFGVIKDRKIASFMMLCNKKGLSEEDIVIDLSEDTVVYVYDAAKRNKVYIGGAGDIEKSYFDAQTLDLDENVISWSEENVYTYALVRMAEGQALDVVVFLNCNK